MIRFPYLKMTSMFILLLSAMISPASAQETIPLPAPKIRGEIMKTLRDRISVKGFNPKELSDSEIGEILWAGFGVANKGSGRRTAQSAFNACEIDQYVLRSDGVFRYDAEKHALRKIDSGDVRGLVARQAYAETAPVHIIYVADYDRARKVYPRSYEEEMKNWANMHTGFIAQNVVLYCSSKGMSAVVRSCGGDSLRKALHLEDHQEIIISQAVGYAPDGYRR